MLIPNKGYQYFYTQVRIITDDKLFLKLNSCMHTPHRHFHSTALMSNTASQCLTTILRSRKIVAMSEPFKFEIFCITLPSPSTSRTGILERYSP